MKTPQEIEKEKYELRIINREIEREKAVAELKAKHLISGTLEEQQTIVLDKEQALNDGVEYSDRFKEIVEPIITDEQVIEEIKKIEDISVPIDEPIKDAIIKIDEKQQDIIIEQEQSQESQT